MIAYSSITVNLQSKDEAPAFLPGMLEGDRRQKQAVSQLDWLIIDLDKGEDATALNEAVRAKGFYALIYSTYSHLSPETEVPLDDYRKFTLSNMVTKEGLRSYLLKARNYPSMGRREC